LLKKQSQPLVNQQKKQKKLRRSKSVKISKRG